jgi:hypothetical protein
MKLTNIQFHKCGFKASTPDGLLTLRTEPQSANRILCIVSRVGFDYYLGFTRRMSAIIPLIISDKLD